MKFNPKPEVYNTLKSLGYTCIQGDQATFKTEQIPAITFSVGSKSARYELDKTPSAYDVEIIVDVWANESTTASRIADEAEEAMREKDYLLTFSSDIPSPEGCLYHTNLRFAAVKIPK